MTMKQIQRLCVASMLQAAVTAQVTWQQAASTGPSARANHAMAYDSLRGRTVLFGGYDGADRGDTWEWNGTNWLQVASGGPTPRHFSALAFDSQRGRTVLFGGWDQSPATFLNDTWEWNGSVWALVSTSGPTPRFGHAMAYDSLRSCVVFFGGATGSGFPSDTWEWDGASWTLRSSAGPSGRWCHGMAYDSRRGRTVLFGGNGSAAYSDTWEWDGTAWSLVATTGPSARNVHSLAFDTHRGRTVLFGGGGIGGLANDTWEWNGNFWTVAAITGPAPRSEHAVAYDIQRARTIVFGGYQAPQLLGDTWECWDPNPAVASASTFGSGCGLPALALSPDVNAPPAIGTTAQAFLTSVPSTLAFVAIGWSNTTAGPFQLPIPLDSYGMQGCFMRQSTDVLGQPVTLTGPSSATYALLIPNSGMLVGRHLYLQAWAVAQGINTANIIVSNGLDWHVGY